MSWPFVLGGSEPQFHADSAAEDAVLPRPHVRPPAGRPQQWPAQPGLGVQLGGRELRGRGPGAGAEFCANSPEGVHGSERQVQVAQGQGSSEGGAVGVVGV